MPTIVASRRCLCMTHPLGNPMEHGRFHCCLPIPISSSKPKGRPTWTRSSLARPSLRQEWIEKRKWLAMRYCSTHRAELKVRSNFSGIKVQALAQACVSVCACSAFRVSYRAHILQHHMHWSGEIARGGSSPIKGKKGPHQNRPMCLTNGVPCCRS